ncbi:MAG: ELM1/GtrOC1 family putative glycosyltransferase [Gammaproteobacteria bacterium]
MSDSCQALILTARDLPSDEARAAVVVADAMGWTYRHEAIGSVANPWLSMSIPNAAKFTPLLASPWPEVLITSGAEMSSVASAARSAGSTAFHIHIGYPKYRSFADYDLVLMPEHECPPDILASVPENVLPYRLGLSGLNAEKLKQVGQSSEARQLRLKKKSPRILGLIGASNQMYRLSPRHASRRVKQMIGLAEQLEGSLMVVTPAHSPPEIVKAIRKAAAGADCEYVACESDQTDIYYRYLSSATHVLASFESSTQLADANASGQMVFMLSLPARRRWIFFRQDALGRLLHAAAIKGRYARLFTGQIRDLSYRSLHEMDRLVPEIKRIQLAHKPQVG